MKILLVDDEELQLLRLEEACKKVAPDNEFLCYTNPLKARDAAKESKIDIAFIDIEMPGLDGIQLAKSLRTYNPSVNIIFVTAYDNYAREAIRIHASGYISKPVNEQKIKEELEVLRFPINQNNEKRLQFKCFGNFEVLYDGQPIKFKYSKSKELLAYLIDREGASINVNELNAILWEEDHSSYLRNIIVDIQKTLEKIGVDNVFIKRRNECFIDITKVDCDAYELAKKNPDAYRLYRGEYMSQYPWATFEEND